MFNHVLLAIDLAQQDTQQAAVEAAKKQLSEGATLYIVSVIPPIEGSGFVQSFLPPDYSKHLIEQGQAALREFSATHFSPDAQIKHLVAHGKVYEKIIDIANELKIDLIIAQASAGKQQAFGPNVARIARYSACSVLLLR